VSVAVVQARPEQEVEPKAQVYIGVNDPFLENLYRQKISPSDYCLVWHEKEVSWENALTQFLYDIVIVDFSLFSENPIVALQRLKRLCPESEIIVLSPDEDVQTVIAAFKIGIADYYLKPTNPETINWAIQKILRRKSLKSKDATLNADLQVFSIAHNISVAETDVKMRDLATRHLVRMLEADGAVWVWPKLEGSDGKAQRLEFYSCTREVAEIEFEKFEKDYPKLIQDSFDTHLTSHPEFWFRNPIIWIPLQTISMGGLLFFGAKNQLDTGDQARVEFLIRNLEVSLENYRRYIEAKQLTYIDDLTGLYNSRFLELTLTSAIQDIGKKNNGFCVLFVDIDKFKAVNDSHGHIVGSHLLTQLGRVLKHSLRKNDQLFRYGGDEFIAVLSDLSLDAAKEIAERLRKSVEKRTFTFGSVHVRVTLSIGIARFPEHGSDRNTIVAMADKAMYHSKKTGRNRVFIAE
jgi:two-component system, cell cycle response regulator